MFQTLPEKNENSNEHSLKNHGTGELDSERKNCANIFPLVRKQIFLFETGIYIEHISFYRSLICYRLTFKLPFGSQFKKY